MKIIDKRSGPTKVAFSGMRVGCTFIGNDNTVWMKVPGGGAVKLDTGVVHGDVDVRSEFVVVECQVSIIK